MFAYRLQEIRSADLIEAAAAHRLAREARRARRAASRKTTAGAGRVRGPGEEFVQVA
ncbi:hypothetical protein [Streptomyces albipurpureus]|uniref:Uncharacterized protein n=1 Tax=Streptomyces albipurpureus TaxID=2897419 RepID=A0ABT0UGI9_9ACTN|nr:hypothetical protein [Streptomyces sp. CWNU-1]MCM2387747.1 hypothetical protein [Streptomyces sp. CWNU-1]